MTVFQPNLPEEDQPAAPSRRDQVWNAMSFLMLAGIIAIVVTFGIIFSNPAVSFNPFPPPTQAVALFLPSNTPRAATLTPTLVYTASSQATEVASTEAASTMTPLPPASTPTIIGGELALTPTATVQDKAVYPFALKGAPALVSASIFNPDRDSCTWLGIGGRVMDLQERPVTGVLVMLGGYANRKTYSLTSLTGLALNYGASGYEFTISDEKPFASKGALWIQLFDQQFIPLSGKVYFDTLEDCDKNLVVVNFKQVR